MQGDPEGGDAAVRSLRQGWEAAFKAMAEAGDDAPLLSDDLEHDWGKTEWRW